MTDYEDRRDQYEAVVAAAYDGWETTVIPGITYAVEQVTRAGRRVLARESTYRDAWEERERVYPAHRDGWIEITRCAPEGRTKLA